MRVQVLGSVRAWRDDDEIDLGSASRKAILGLLTLARGQPVPRPDLIDALWRDRPPPTATNIIQTHVKHLRRLLEPARRAHSPSRCLPAIGDGYALRLPAAHLDVTAFRDLLLAAMHAHHAGDRNGEATLLGDALARWHGPPLADVPALAEHPKVLALLGEWRTALAQYGEVMVALGQAERALPVLAEAAASAPMDEAIQARLMRAYHATGQRARAFATYHAVKRLLAGELGIGPGPELASAHLQLLRDDPQDADDTEPGAVTVHNGLSLVDGEERCRGPAQLPADVAGFIGRATELAALDKLCRPDADGAVPIVVLTGTAGVGKTALAVRFAHRVRRRFPSGQLYVNLRGYDPDQPMHPGETLSRFLNALGVPDADIPLDVDERSARFRTEVADRRLLVLLDNASTVEQVRALLPGTASCLVVVTSRDSLSGLVALHGAHRLELGLLSAGEAVALLDRLIGARARQDPASAAELAAQCARLPLALRVAAELAVSRPAATLAELVRELADRQQRLRMLHAGTDGRAAVSEVYSWSYQHLAPAAKRAFRRLGLHPGPDIDASIVAALTGDPAERAEQSLRLLSRASLVEAADADRFTMHDLLRAYALERAEAEDGAADRLAAQQWLLDYFLDAAARATAEPAGPPDADRARRWLARELPNLTAVSGFAAAQGWVRHAVELASTLNKFVEGGHYVDGLALHGNALSAAQRAGDEAGQAQALMNLGVVYRLLGRYATAADHHCRALALHQRTGDRHGEARTLSNLGILDERLGRYETAVAHQERALRLYRELGDRRGEASALTNLGNVYSRPGEYPRAAEHLRRALELFREVGDCLGEASALCNLGDVYTSLRRFAPAADALSAALELFEAMRHESGQAITLANLGQAYTQLGEPERAERYLRQALEVLRSTGHRYGEASARNGLGEALAAAGRHADALVEHEAALGIATETGDRDEQIRAHTGIGDARHTIGEVGRGAGALAPRFAALPGR